MAQFDAAFKGDAAALRAWLEANGGKKQVDALSRDRKCTLLYTAARQGHFECAKMLVDDFGADVSRANGDAEVGSTPLHAACYGGFPPCVALLVVRGAKADAKNKLGETPLDNAKSPAAGVGAAVKRKCQELLGDATAAAAQLQIAVKNLGVAAAAAGKAAPAVAAAAAADEDEEAPPAKAKKTEAVPVAAKKPAAKKAPAADGPHPLVGKTLVFTGAFVQKKALHEAAVHAIGGKATGSVSSKTDVLVKGKNSGGKEWDALSRGIPVWTEAQFLAVMKDGASAWPQPPAPLPCMAKLMQSPKLSDDDKQSLVNIVNYAFHEALSEPHSSFMFRRIALKSGETNVHKLGVEGVSPILAAFPGQEYDLIDAGLADGDVKVIFGALASRSLSLPPIKLIDLGMNPKIGDIGAQAIADALPTMQLETLYLYSATSLTAKGINALLKALERSPSMQSLQLQSIENVDTCVKAWRAGSGKNVACVVDADGLETAGTCLWDTP